jgi:diguanylate cyclase (GGDEF)-like protein/PAS domain S-box-containing protein
MTKAASRFFAPPRAVWFAVFAVLLTIGLFLAYFIHNERTLSLERERERLLGQIRVIDANIALQLVGVDAALRNQRPATTVSSLDVNRNQERSTTLRVMSDAMPAVRTMLLIDVRGKVVSSNRPETIGFDASQRPYFLTASTNPKSDLLYVSAPFTTSLGAFALNLVKAWTDDKGHLIGVSSATLDPDYFKVLLRSVLYADDMRTTLIHGDGQAFFTLPPNPSIQGANLRKPGTVFTQHLASGQTESYHVVHVALTNDQRLVAYRTVQPPGLKMDKPLLLAVSREMGAVLAPWRQLALVLSAAYTVVSLLVLSSVFVFQRKQEALRELRRARESDAREQAERLDLALSGGDLALVDVDLATGVRRVNSRAQEIVGDGPNDPVDSFSAWFERMHPEDREGVRALRQSHERGQTDAFVADYRVRHKDGHWVWIHSRSRITLRSADGSALRMVGTYQDISDRKLAEAQIVEFAFSDSLTKLPNRRLLMDRLNQSQAASARSGKPGAVLFMDLDRFKAVNDTQGHDMGDLLLQHVALRLQACVRQSDTVARLGGDEFVVVLDQVGNSREEAQTHALRTAGKILSALSEPIQLRDQSHTVTSSVGITLFVGGTANAAQLLKEADQALYQAKGDGRNRAVICTAPATV